jgi:hypothetical protein
MGRIFYKADRRLNLEHLMNVLLERFHKCCSGASLVIGTAVFLIFGFVSAQSQGYSNLLLHRSLAKNQKSSLHTATSFLSTL